MWWVDVDGHWIMGESCGGVGGCAFHWSASSRPPRLQGEAPKNTIAGSQLCLKQHHLRLHPSTVTGQD